MKLVTILALAFLGSCAVQPSASVDLKRELLEIADAIPGTVGIAFVSDSDTITVNNAVRYPMMSVMKLHEALAVVHRLNGLDSTLTVTEAEIDCDTWSPMLKEYTTTPFTISTDRLIGYAVSESDNNASNILFSRIISPEKTEQYIKATAPDTTFSLKYSEAQMKRNHELSYSNSSTPLSAALLIRQVMENDNPGEQTVRDALANTTTGSDRLAAAVEPADSVEFAHKTGSGYRNASGELIAHNDVGHFRFPDGRSYSLAVFLRDFRGSEAEASEVIAQISKTVYRHFKTTP